MTLGERLDAAIRYFQFRGRKPDSQQPPPQQVRGEIAFADPRRLFPGAQPYATYNPSVLVGSRGLSIFDEMMRDDQVKAALAFKKHACIATGWTVSSPEGKGEDWEPTVFAKWVLENLDPDEIGSTTLDADLYEVLGALNYGFSVTEKIWGPIEDGEFEGRIALRSLKTRAPHSINFAQDVHGNLMPDGIIQQVNTFVKAGRMPRSKFVLFTYQSQFGNPYGTSDLEATYSAWWAKYNSQKWLAMLLERLGIPPIFGLYNPQRYTGGTLTEDLKKVISNLQAATFGIIPRPDKDSLEFWAPELAGNATRVFIPSLDYFNKAIARSILMPDLLGMTSDTSQGSYARAKVHFDVFLLVVEQIRRDLQNAINHQVIRPLLDLNFPGLEEYPRWHFLPLTDDLRLELISQWDQLVVDQVVVRQEDDEKYIRRMLQFPEKRPGQELPPIQVAPPGAATTNGAPTNGAVPKTPSPAAPRGASPRRFFTPDDSAEYADWDESKHPRAPAGGPEGGQWTSGGDGGGGTTTDRRPTDTREWHNVTTVSEAYTRLSKGQRVAIDRPAMISTLMDRLATAADIADRTGRKVSINLCDVSLRGSNIFCMDNKGIPRVRMPQLNGTPSPGSKAAGMPANRWGEVDIAPAFIDHLRSKGIRTTNENVLASHLKATQNELDGTKVSALMRSIERRGYQGTPLFVTMDDYIVDGHHRWAAKIGIDARAGLKATTIPVQRVHAPILKVLIEAWRFSSDMGMPSAAGGAIKVHAVTDIAVMLADWDESKHPRDDRGRWTEDGGGGSDDLGFPAGKGPSGNVPNAPARLTRASLNKALKNVSEGKLTPDVQAVLKSLNDPKDLFTNRPDDAKRADSKIYARLHEAKGAEKWSMNPMEFASGDSMDEVDLANRVAERGEHFSTEHASYPVSVPRYCHQNAAVLYAQGRYAAPQMRQMWRRQLGPIVDSFPESDYGIATGYYGTNDTKAWFHHSWLYNKKTGAVVETTGNRASHYFGMKLTDTEARRFSSKGGMLPLYGD